MYAYEAWVVCMHMEVVCMHMRRGLCVCMHMRRVLCVCIWRLCIRMHNIMEVVHI